jgi:acetyl-CoA synthetase
MPAVPIDASARPDAYQCVDAAFEWQSPEYFNMAQACCERWAARQDAHERIAIRTYGKSAKAFIHTYAELADQAKRLSAVLHDLGVVRGDRVAIVLPQCFETAVVYIAALQMGAVAMPLSMLFGPQALAYRLQDSDAVVAIGDAQTLPTLQAVRSFCPGLRQIIGVGEADLTCHLADVNYAQALGTASAQFAAIPTRADDPAILIYTSGTTGNPKGALIPHRALIGNLSGFVCSQNGFGFPDAGRALIPVSAMAHDLGTPRSQAVFWSPADWAWTGGLMDALLPTLYFGRPIVAFNGRFSPQTALQLLRDCAVTHSFLFPTALKALMKAYPGTSQANGAAAVRAQAASHHERWRGGGRRGV